MASSATGVRSRFWGKVAGAGVLVALGDWLFWQRGGPGSAIGAFAFAWTVVTAFFRPAMLRDRRALLCLLFATLAAGLMIDDPSLLGWCLFWIALTLATLLPRAVRYDDAARWAVRLLVHGATSLAMPVIDIGKVGGSRRGSRRILIRGLLPVIAVPLAGTLLFIALFAAANPLIGDVLGRIALPDLDLPRLSIWVVLAILVWGSLRPSRMHMRLDADPDRIAWVLPGTGPAAIRLSLILFNLVFAVQNGLDIAFLWSGQPLPGHVTLADYAHRGAYTLIVTALLAGLFVLVTLRPGSETARVPAIRRLVMAWTAQNILLVASSMLRTIDYVEAYSLTVLRIAALAWMALVAVGLALICWRLIRGRSGAWLVNANAVALLVVLGAATAIDLGSVAANWNVRHAREVGGGGPAIDLCYLAGLGPSALVSLAELERAASEPVFRDRVAAVRAQTQRAMLWTMAHGGWTWRNARRLDRIAAIGRLPQPIARKGWYRDCDGELIAPAPPVPPVEIVAPPQVPAASPPPAAAPANAPLTKGDGQ
jgi:hypothetical protein